MQAHARIIVKGFVQGVGFRYYAHREATSLGLNGYVKNMAEGSVLSEVEGERDLVEEYIKALKIGPSWSKVSSVDAEWGACTGKFHGFSVTF